MPGRPPLSLVIVSSLKTFSSAHHRSRVSTHLIEGLAVVDSDDGSDHFWDDDHVAQVGLDDCGLLHWGSLFLGLAQLLEKGHWLALQATGETPADTAVHQLAQLLVGHVQELIQVNSAVSEFTEGTLLAHLFFWCDLKRDGGLVTGGLSEC